LVDKSDLRKVAVLSAEDELTDALVYEKLSQKYGLKKPEFSKTLHHLAETEKGHYRFWKRYTEDTEIRASSMRVRLIMFLRVLLGTTFAIKYLEKNEKEVIKTYRSVASLIPDDDKANFERMVKDEEEHEGAFAEQLQGPAIKYISFIILGLADAIVEISGIHAGSLGIFNRTEITGLAGIVAGAAASIAMASAAYAQAKQGGFKGRPFISAIATGISYFVNAVVLATPYFLTSSQVIALFTSVVFASIIIAFTSYYNAIISGSRFLRDFAELAGVMYGATVALYVFGLVVGSFTGMRLSSV
jgi:VIT1/CCC1 family predicted Fe2+/Mn2+ transporter